MIDSVPVGSYLDVGDNRVYFQVEPNYNQKGYEPSSRNTDLLETHFRDSCFVPGAEFTLPDRVLETLIRNGSFEVMEQGLEGKTAHMRCYGDN